MILNAGLIDWREKVCNSNYKHYVDPKGSGMGVGVPTHTKFHKMEKINNKANEANTEKEGNK